MKTEVARKSGYLPGLDGLRAIAILGVLMTHDLPWTFRGHSNVVWKGYGGYGVQLFFAISGVLICWRLLEDEAKQGSLRLGAFYTRRIFRIQPAALVYLLFIALLTVLHQIPAGWFFWLAAVFSFINFLISASTPPGAPAFTGHFWTLSVEEHFYILISLLFLLPRKQRIYWLGAILFLMIVGQEIATDLGWYHNMTSERLTYWTVQYLLVPSFLVFCIREPRMKKFAETYLQPWMIGFLFLLLAFAERTELSYFQILRVWTVNNFMDLNRSFLFYGFGFLVIAVMLHPDSLTTRFLELRPLRFLGRISYSLYLWHILFFISVYLPEQIQSKTLLWLSERPQKYIASLACALLSYYFIEKPFIRYGHKIAPPATEGHRDLTPA